MLTLVLCHRQRHPSTEVNRDKKRRPCMEQLDTSLQRPPESVADIHSRQSMFSLTGPYLGMGELLPCLHLTPVTPAICETYESSCARLSSGHVSRGYGSSCGTMAARSIFSHVSGGPFGCPAKCSSTSCSRRSASRDACALVAQNAPHSTPFVHQRTSQCSLECSRSLPTVCQGFFALRRSQTAALFASSRVDKNTRSSRPSLLDPKSLIHVPWSNRSRTLCLVPEVHKCFIVSPTARVHCCSCSRALRHRHQLQTSQLQILPRDLPKARLSARRDPKLNEVWPPPMSSPVPTIFDRASGATATMVPRTRTHRVTVASRRCTRISVLSFASVAHTTRSYEW